MFIFTLLLIIYHDDRLVEYSFNIVLMQVATRKLQNLLQKSQYSFSGFGKYLINQLDRTIHISTKII
jgi:hypothetical protein